MIDTLRAIANASPHAASRAARARTEIRDPAHGGQPWRAAAADGVRAGRRDLARGRRCRADADAFSRRSITGSCEPPTIPSAYNQLLDIAWKLALVFGCAFAAEWLVFRLIKRPVALLEARLPQAGARPGADAGDGRSAILRGGCRRGAGAAPAASQPGARLAVAGQAAVRAGTSRARTAPGARLRRRRHDAAGHRDRRSRDHPARDPRGRQCLCAVARADLRRAGAGGTVRPVSRSRRDRGLYRDLGAAHRRRRRVTASPLPMWRCCWACIAPAMRRCCGW